MQKIAVIVDDMKDVRDWIVEIVTAKGCKALDFASRDDAIVYIEASGVPDVILLDYIMPGMKCEEFMSRLSALTTTLPPIFLLTAAVDAEQHAEALGITEVIQKPFSTSELLAKLELCEP